MYVQYGRPRSSRISYPLPLSACVSFRRYRRVVVGEYTANRQPYEPHIPYQRSIESSPSRPVEINININSNITDGGDNEPLNTPTTTTTPLLKSTNLVQCSMSWSGIIGGPTYQLTSQIECYRTSTPSNLPHRVNHPPTTQMTNPSLTSAAPSATLLTCTPSFPHRTLHNPVHTSHSPPHAATDAVQCSTVQPTMHPTRPRRGWLSVSPILSVHLAVSVRMSHSRSPTVRHISYLPSLASWSE